MKTNGRDDISHNQNLQKTEISLQELISIVKRRKKTILISTLSTLVLVLLYNFFASPVYESTVTLKKDVINNRGTSSEFKEMFSMQTMDELDTEIEIIKTRTVIEKIIKELNLLVQIKKIETASGKIQEFNIPLFIYDIQNKSTVNGNPPQFTNLDIDTDNPFITKEYYLKVSQPDVFELYEYESNYLIYSAKNDSVAQFNLEGLYFEIKWPNSKIGDKINFKINNFESLVRSLQNSIMTSKVGNTNIFQVSFRSKSPLAARLIANTIVEKYRENRLGQKRQSIHSSFEFVDDQLKEISDKLKNAELELGLFKSEHKITNMAESSSEIVSSLSNLEAEKVTTDLELADYRNKMREMKKEQEKKGYIDQTYLAPGGADGARSSPFSDLLGQLSDAEIKRLELLQKRRDNHPDIVAIDEQIAQIKSRLAEYNKNTMASYQIIIKTLQKKQYNLASLIKKYASKLENIPGQETALIELTRNKNAFEKMFTLLLDKREELRMAEFSKLQDIIIVDPARLPFKPVSPRKALNIILGVVLGLIIGIIAIFIQEFLEEKITDIAEIEKQFSIPILSIIPEYNKELIETTMLAENINQRLVNLMENQGEYLESYRLLRTRLFSFSKNGNNAFVFTSSEADTGKSTIVANMGVSLARTGKKVLLIDGDLKMAGLSSLFSIPDSFPDLEEYLTTENNIPILFKPFKEHNSNLDINLLSAGKGGFENSSELFELEKMNTLIKYGHSNYDYVLIDTPPVTQLVDTLILGNYAPNFIFIIKPNHTNKEGVKFAFEEIKHSSINVCGFVVNACNVENSTNRYKYGYGYGYGYGK